MKRTVFKFMCALLSAALVLGPVSAGAVDRSYAPYKDNSVHRNTLNADCAAADGYLGQDLDADHDMGGDGDGIDPIVVAVIDSGLCPDHPDIDYSHVLEGACFTDDGDSTVDEYGHGTFVTGEILAARNGYGIDGLASEAYVMPVKAFDAKSASVYAVAEALDYVTQQRVLYDETKGESGANVCVVNMSLAKKTYSELLSSAVNRAVGAGIIVICACGNYGDDSSSYPAQNAIGVGTVDADGGLDSYAGKKACRLSEDNGAGYRNKVWVSAPGERYGSLWYNGGYYTQSGSSFASAQVAALAAIAVGICNDLTECVPEGATVDNGSGMEQRIVNNHQAFKYLLRQTANLRDYNTELTSYAGKYDPIDGQDPYYGWGVVDFGAMIEAIGHARGTAHAPEGPEEPEAPEEPEGSEEPEVPEGPETPEEPEELEVPEGAEAPEGPEEPETPEEPEVPEEEFVPVAPVEPERGTETPEPPEPERPAEGPDPAAAAETPAEFVDVPENAYYALPVAWALEKGITNGTDRTHFSPDAPCTRGQMAVLLWKAAGRPEPKGGDCGFTDVPADAYYREAVLWAVEQGITTGTGGGCFSPNRSVTRAQAVTFLARMAGVTDEASMIPHGFTDVPADAYYRAAVSWAKLNGITTGTGGESFSPNRECSRAQIITFLYRFCHRD